MQRAVRFTITDGVCHVALAAGANGNAINFDLIDGLTEAIDAAEGDETCRAVVLSAEGAAFCRGLDLEAFFVRGTLPERSRLRRLPACLARIRRARLPVIACVDGEVTGGGVGLVAACDLVLATGEARFMLSETIVGLVPATIVPFLLLRIGPARLRSMTLGTRGIPAAEAHTYGLVDELAEDGLDRALSAQLKRVFRSSPHALAEAKRYYDGLSAADFDQQIENGLDQFTRWLAREEVAQGVQMFGEGVAPPWFARYEGRVDVARHSNQ
jgi:enoyl-CoA hydratase/carnithine racemase